MPRLSDHSSIQCVTLALSDGVLAVPEGDRPVTWPYHVITLTLFGKVC